MARWYETYAPEDLSKVGTLTGDRPITRILQLIREIQQRVPNAVVVEGDAYISVDASIDGADLRLKITLENPPVSLPAGGEAGQVLTRTTGDLESGDGAQWDWVRAVDL